MEPARRPAIGDVARSAGVSPQTVSRVLNGSPSVRPATRSRVLAAIETLGYRPNPAARALASRRSTSLGVVAVESSLYGPTSTLYAVERAARAAGYGLIVTSVPAGEPGSTPEAVDRLLRQGVAGAVVIAPLLGTSKALAALTREVPLVVTQGRAGKHGTVAVDQVAGAAEVTRHLLEQGEGSCPWHVGGPVDWLEALQREKGWQDTVTRAGLVAPPVLRGDWTPSSGYAAAHELVRHDPNVRTVFFANDHMALGGLRAFQELGIRVPQEVLVAGFDDVPEAEFLSPPLTSVAQDFLALGESAVRQLVQALEGAPVPRQKLIAPRLVVRQSTALG
ncbi:MAG: LacI family DNA-binding transcriptional regulator [Mycobacteriales bacterium]